MNGIPSSRDIALQKLSNEISCDHKFPLANSSRTALWELSNSIGSSKMMTLKAFSFPLLLGFFIGMLFSYTIVLKRSALLVWPIDLSGNESGPTRTLLDGDTTVFNQISFADSQFHGGIVKKYIKSTFVCLCQRPYQIGNIYSKFAWILSKLLKH